jgi:squalene monooxygenase
MASLNGHATRSQAAQRRIEHHEADVVIVGAGILGCALAFALGKQGRSVILLEKSLEEPNRIVGELLQPGGVQALEKLGLRDCLEDIDGIDVKGYWVSYFGEPVLLEYPKSTSSGPAPLGRAFHHGRFVMKLRQAALSCPNVTVVETKVTGLVTSSHTQEVLGVECVTKDLKDCYFGQLTVAADGYNSDFRKKHHKYTPKRRSKFYGLELIDAKLPAPNTGHVLLSDSPPVLMYQIGTHETRILVDVPDNLPGASVKNGGVKGYMKNTILPRLPEGAQASFSDALEKGQLRSMPNSFLPASTNTTPGLMILGDALNMRHPLTGGGMTVAFNDVCVIRELLSPELVPSFSDTDLVLKQLAQFHWARKNSSSVINILAQALYSLFAADGMSSFSRPKSIPQLTVYTDRSLRSLQRGCFRYFQIGPVGGPVGLLAGLIKQPSILVSHFFSVAFLSIWVLFCETPLTQILLFPYYAFMILYTACIVILPYIWTEIWY